MEAESSKRCKSCLYEVEETIGEAHRVRREGTYICCLAGLFLFIPNLKIFETLCVASRVKM
jgi:hypothetical protein